VLRRSVISGSRRGIPLEVGAAAQLPVLVIIAVHAHFLTAGILTGETEDLLLGSW